MCHLYTTSCVVNSSFPRSWNPTSHLSEYWLCLFCLLVRVGWSRKRLLGWDCCDGGRVGQSESVWWWDVLSEALMYDGGMVWEWGWCDGGMIWECVMVGCSEWGSYDGGMVMVGWSESMWWLEDLSEAAVIVYLVQILLRQHVIARCASEIPMDSYLCQSITAYRKWLNT